MPVVIPNDDWLVVNGRLSENKKDLPALIAVVADIIGQIEKRYGLKTRGEVA